MNIIGQTYNLLTVVRRAGTTDGKILWHCKCACGGAADVRSTYLRTGHTLSCGCLKRTASSRRAFIHTAPRSYVSWRKMWERCTNPNATQWKWYGGRGITVCARWSDFRMFVADMGERPPGLTLDRIDPDGNYEPSNCRWATWKQQANNRSRL